MGEVAECVADAGTSTDPRVIVIFIILLVIIGGLVYMYNKFQAMNNHVNVMDNALRMIFQGGEEQTSEPEGGEAMSPIAEENNVQPAGTEE
tara:strand:- start:585 stop:857 length:273 start_codon:yes stop_codon:yes gene_type:complete